MADVINYKVIDNFFEHSQHNEYDEHCSECYREKEDNKVSCKICNDEGIVYKTEWSGTDDSYEIANKCECQLD